MIDEGVDIIDVGGVLIWLGYKEVLYKEVLFKEEMNCVLFVVEFIVKYDV